MTVSEGVAGRHRVLGVLAERARTGRRDDGHRVALAVEGGGMRGTVSAGMAMTVDELGLTRLFDAVYGASAGALSGAWLLSSRPEGLRGWTDPAVARALIRRRNMVLGRPLVNVERLVEVHYVRDFPLDFASVLASDVEYHPLATDVVTGEAVDLHSRVTDAATLRLALRASSALPLLAGGPVRIGDGVYYDAGLAESIPYRRALADGATHVLVLRSRRPADGTARSGPSRGTRLVAGVGLRRYGPGLRTSFLGRNDRLAADDRLLAEHDADAVPSGPAVLSIRPPDSSPHVGRLERDGALLEAAFEAGRAAAAASLAPLADGLADGLARAE
ncbi:patatin-like phospholipase family protein [Actinomadura algeriensis]|uniref:Patatin/cPLA2 family phospholipase n=1 Tax=Actinomadura algeriensis TaxID=1679523 RepID=A0ABR9JPF0_9ACTN|nr:patatin-like phospholipase family protein [Actinomadura algeriensis]MBE1532449.1 putative patatin/cPLA2 family phospholipase [Actinomadura algeriensis]